MTSFKESGRFYLGKLIQFMGFIFDLFFITVSINSIREGRIDSTVYLLMVIRPRWIRGSIPRVGIMK